MPKAVKKVKIMEPVPNQDKIQFEVKDNIEPKIKQKDIFEVKEKMSKMTGEEARQLLRSRGEKRRAEQHATREAQKKK